MGGSIDNSARKRSHALIDLKKEAFIGAPQSHFPKKTEFYVRKTPAAQTGVRSKR